MQGCTAAAAWIALAAGCGLLRDMMAIPRTPAAAGVSGLRKPVGLEQAEIPYRYGGQDHGGAVDDGFAAVGHRLCHGALRKPLKLFKYKYLTLEKGLCHGALRKPLKLFKYKYLTLEKVTYRFNGTNMIPHRGYKPIVLIIETEW
jgi:hypothetical protein